MFKILALATLAVAALADDHTDWNYDNSDKENGPDGWEIRYPDCGRLKQSPININTKKTKFKKESRLPDIDWIGGYPETEYTIVNTGRYLLIYKPEGFGITIEGGPMQKTYNLANIQMRWRKSEHKINGGRQEAEIQFHFEDPIFGPDANEGRYVIAVLVNQGSKNSGLEPLIDAVPDLLQPNSQTTATFSLEKLLPKRFEGDFYAYSGSLTDPPCTQNVQWHVARKTIRASSRQLRELRNMLDHEGEEIDKNYRPVQRLNARYVFKSFSSSSSSGFGGLSSLLG